MGEVISLKRRPLLSTRISLVLISARDYINPRAIARVINLQTLHECQIMVLEDPNM
jgi:hypothetical protein